MWSLPLNARDENLYFYVVPESFKVVDTGKNEFVLEYTLGLKIRSVHSYKQNFVRDKANALLKFKTDTIQGEFLLGNIQRIQIKQGEYLTTVPILFTIKNRRLRLNSNKDQYKDSEEAPA